MQVVKKKPVGAPGRAAHRTRLMDRRVVGGFTLIELLIVVGIIGLLMAILLPALGRARQEALKIGCAANLRQFGAGFHAWAGDHNGRFPYNGGNSWGLHATEEAEWGGEWMEFGYDYVAEYDARAVRQMDSTVYFCPSDNRRAERGWYPQPDRNNTTDLIRLGYFIFAGRTPPPDQDEYFNGVRRWMTRSHLDGPFAAAPIMSDINRRNTEGEWAGRPWRNDWQGPQPKSTHMNPADQDGVLGMNHLFEDGSVQWFNNEVISLGSRYAEEPRESWFHVPIPGIVDEEQMQ